MMYYKKRIYVAVCSAPTGIAFLNIHKKNIRITVLLPYTLYLHILRVFFKYMSSLNPAKTFNTTLLRGIRSPAE